MSIAVAAVLMGVGVALLVLSLRRQPVPAAGGGEIVAPVSRWRRPALLEASGLVYGTDRDLSRLALQQVVATMLLGALALSLLLAKPSSTTAIAAAPLVMLGWKGPLIVVRSREKKRRKQVDLELVDALGEMVMGVEAGLTLDVVMLRYSQTRTTPLADEFRAILDQVQLGSPRADALVAMGVRTPTPMVRMFSTALVQNQRLGTPLAGVLRQQAMTARRQRRQAVEEKAAKVPMKMIFPTVFCVLPVLMIVVVGPAIIRLMHALP